MRKLAWFNAVVLLLLWAFVADDVYYKTYGWWTRSDSNSHGLAHSPLIFVFLLVLVLGCVAFLINVLLLVHPAKLYRKPIYWAGTAMLAAALAECFGLPGADSLNMATVMALGPGEHASVLLFNSAALGNTRTTRRLLEDGVKLHPDEGLVYIGATFGKLETIKMGMARGEDINAVGRRGYTPLRSSIVNRNLNAVDFLLGAGALPTQADLDGIAELRSRGTP